VVKICSALVVVITDFGWLSDIDEVVILHRDLPTLDDKDLAIYLDVLREAVASWRSEEGGFRLRVCFPAEDCASVERVVRQLSDG